MFVLHIFSWRDSLFRRQSNNMNKSDQSVQKWCLLNPGDAHAHFIVRDFFRSGGAWLH